MSIFTKLANAVVGQVPIIGKLLTGKNAERAKDIIASALGVENTEDDILKALAADPNAFAKLKEAEQNHETELLRLQLADVQNARGREIEITKLKGSDLSLAIVGTAVVAGFFIVAALLMFIEVPKDSQPILNTLFGFLGAGFSTVIAYFFGSSKSSSEKTKMLGVPK